jgi:hypothetical protein
MTLYAPLGRFQSVFCIEMKYPNFFLPGCEDDYYSRSAVAGVGVKVNHSIMAGHYLLDFQPDPAHDLHLLGFVCQLPRQVAVGWAGLGGPLAGFSCAVWAAVTTGPLLVLKAVT